MNYDTAEIVTAAVVRLQEILNLSDADIGEILDLDRSNFVRRKKCHALVREGEKRWESALLIIRAFRALSAILGNDNTTLRHWLDSDNSALGSRPVDLIKTTEGLVRTVKYLEAMKN